jgi:hypothetical protein
MYTQRIDAIKKRIKTQTDHLDQLIAGEYSGECIYNEIRYLKEMYEYLSLVTIEECPEEDNEYDDSCCDCCDHDKDYLNDLD